MPYSGNNKSIHHNVNYSLASTAVSLFSSATRPQSTGLGLGLALDTQCTYINIHSKLVDK